MKKLTTLLLVGASAMLIAQSAQAQSTQYATGDLIVGFYDKNNSNDYIIDLGADSQFTTTAGISAFNAEDISIGTDLSTFNSGAWATDANLNWGAAGYSGATGSNGIAAKTLFLTEADGATAPTEKNPTITGNIGAAIATAGNAFSSQPTTSAYDALVQSSTATSSYESYQVGTVSVNSFGSGFNINNAITATDSGLDLYEMFDVNNGTATKLGELEISSTGALSFVTQSTPEPSTYALLALGVGVLAWTARRRNSAFRA